MKRLVIVLLFALSSVSVLVTADSGLVVVSDNFDNGDSDSWEIYEWVPLPGGGADQVFHPVSLESRGGVADSSYAWGDDSRWTVDVPDSNSILAFLVYHRYWTLQWDLRNAVVSVHLRGESLDLKEGKVYFWVYDFETCTRYHYTGYPLTISTDGWGAKLSFVLEDRDSLWFRSWSCATPGNLEDVLSGVDSYGFSFREFSSEVMGRLDMDEFSITYEPVRAGFMAEPLVGSSPLTVVFTNVTTGSRNQQIWNFGDGITDTLVNPVHEYTVPGVYTVTLNASGPGGDDVITRTSYLSVYAPVRADFVAEPTSGVAPLAVSFTNNTSGDYVTSVWSFGDGVTSTLPSPTHTYAAPGVYTVMLNASGLGGNDVITRTNQIRVLWQSFMPVILKQTGP